MARQRGRSGRGGSALTASLAVLAVVLAAAAVLLWLRDQGRPSEPVVPTAIAGENELIHVQRALEAEELEVSAQPEGLPPGELGVPGQRLDASDRPLYVFVYPDREAAAAAFAALDPATALPAANARGTPVATEPPYLAHGSNVIVALIGGDDDLRQKVDAAMAGLP